MFSLFTHIVFFCKRIHTVVNNFKNCISSVALAICFLPFKLFFFPKLEICLHFNFYRVDFYRVFYRVDPETPAYEEPKFIVFHSMLLQLFTLSCFKCKASGPSATMRQHGTMVTVIQSCSQCLDQYVWKFQPPPLCGKFPIGKMLLSFAILMS